MAGLMGLLNVNHLFPLGIVSSLIYAVLGNLHKIQYFSHHYRVIYQCILKLLMVQTFENHFVPIWSEKTITVLKCLFPVEHGVRETGFMS